MIRFPKLCKIPEHLCLDGDVGNVLSWGFDALPQKDNLVYLDYAIRRLSAFPNIWWSLANEYDISSKSLEDWEEIEEFVPIRSGLSPFKRPPFAHQRISCSGSRKVSPWVQ